MRRRNAAARRRGSGRSSPARAYASVTSSARSVEIEGFASRLSRLRRATRRVIIGSASDIHVQSKGAQDPGERRNALRGKRGSVRHAERPPEPGVLLGAQPVIWNYINSN